MPRISDARVLIVATDGFEEWELFGPREALFCDDICASALQGARL